MQLILPYMINVLENQFEVVKCKAHNNLELVQKLYSKFSSDIIEED
jgi:hypothetical protein